MIYGVRHGQTPEDAEPDPKFSGPGDIGLDDKGKDQARLVGEFLNGKAISYLLTSPIQRSVETAEIIGEIIGLKPRVVNSLRDWNNGAVAGLKIKDILPFVVFFERNPDLTIPGGEQYAAWWDSSDDGLEYLLDQPFEDINLAFVSHSRFLAVSKMKIEGKGMEPTDFSGSPKPGGAVAISRDNSGKVLLDLAFGEWNGQTRAF